jgi:outer membrane protein OmpA-like peptidoglycan-associated protein
VSAVPVRAHDVLPPRRLDRTAEREAAVVARGGTRRPLGLRPSGRGGEPLPPAVLAWAAPRVGVDLAGVRVHHDAEAAAATAERNARAVTAGGDVLFADGEYSPGTPSGRELLLHELAHVAQQAEEGTRVAQHDDPPKRADGPGRTPPDANYSVASLPLKEGEDEHFLFEDDRIDVDVAAVADKARKLFATHKGAVVVGIHGYASDPGDAEYNLNLSAHRAVVVSNAIASVLPAGSTVNLIAHGSTRVFGRAGLNRRVGLDVWDMPAESPIDADRFLRYHFPQGFFPELTFRPFTLPDLPPSRTPAEVATGATEKQPPPRGILDPGQITDPKGTIFGSRIDPPSFLRPDPFGWVGPRIKWGDLGEEAQSRGVLLNDGDRAVVSRHWQLYHPLARALWGFPIVSKIFDDPDDLMTTLSKKMISSALSGDYPTTQELWDREAERFGIPSPTYAPSIPIFSFDPNFGLAKKPWWLP